MKIQEEISDGLLQIVSEYGLRVLLTNGTPQPVEWRNKILKYLDSKGVRIEKENVWYNNVLVPVNERLVEE